MFWFQAEFKWKGLSRLTYNFKDVGEKDDGLGGPRPVGPASEQRPWQQPAEAERRQTQTEEIGWSVQDLEVFPDGGQDDGWKNNNNIINSLVSVTI